MIKACTHCGRFFKTYNPDKIYCSQDCRKRAHHKRSRKIRKLKEVAS